MILGGLYLKGLIDGGAYFQNFTVPCDQKGVKKRFSLSKELEDDIVA